MTEEDEDFTVTLTSDDPQAETGPPDRAVVTIEDNDRECSLGCTACMGMYVVAWNYCNYMYMYVIGYYIIFTAATIGFEETVYTVNERDRQVVVAVILDGELSDDVRVRLTTEDGSATRSSEFHYRTYVVDIETCSKVYS